MPENSISEFIILLWSGVASLCKIESELVFMAAPDPFQQQQGKASIFDETREQNRVTKCILTKAKRKEKREKGPAEAIGELQCTVLVFFIEGTTILRLQKHQM